METPRDYGLLAESDSPGSSRGSPALCSSHNAVGPSHGASGWGLQSPFRVPWGRGLPEPLPLPSSLRMVKSWRPSPT
jgi:hypothetical protein